MENFNEIDNKITSFLANNYVSQTITVVLILYTVLVAPRLSRDVCSTIDNPIVKLLIFVLIAYLATKDYKISLGLIVSYIITLNICEKHKLNDKLVLAIVSDQISTANKDNIVQPQDKDKLILQDTAGNETILNNVNKQDKENKENKEDKEDKEEVDGKNNEKNNVEKFKTDLNIDTDTYNNNENYDGIYSYDVFKDNNIANYE